MSEGKRIGLIGLGRVADVHYAAMRAEAGRAELVAVCDVRPEACRERSAAWGVPGYGSVRELLDEATLDAVVVMLPHHVHLSVMREVLGRGLPVLLEKPIAVRREEADEIVSLADAAGVPVLVGHNGLFHPAYKRFRQIVERGWIGTPLTASARSLQWLDFRPWDFRLDREATGGGAWIDCAGHLLYRLEGVLGEPETLRGFGSGRARDEMEGEDTAAAVVRYASGAVAQVLVSYGYKLPGYEHDWPHGCEQAVIVSGNRGVVEYQVSPRSRLRLFSEIPGVMPDLGGGWLEIDVPEPFEASFTGQMSHFLDCVEGRATPVVTPRRARDLLETLLSFYES